MANHSPRKSLRKPSKPSANKHANGQISANPPDPNSGDLIITAYVDHFQEFTDKPSRKKPKTTPIQVPTTVTRLRQQIDACMRFAETLNHPGKAEFLKNLRQARRCLAE